MDKLRSFELEHTEHRAILLVEGVQDALFCEAVFEHLRLPDKVQIVEAGGRPNIPTSLINIARSRRVRINSLLRLGILQDADQSAESSRTDVVDALRNAGLPIPSARSTDENAETLTVSVFIAPNNRSQGSLEDLCLSSLTADEVQCLDEHIDCVSQNDADLKPHLVSKVKVALHLATEPAFRRYDMNLPTEVRDNLRPGIPIGLAARYHIWDWSQPEFKPIESFLRRLAAV